MRALDKIIIHCAATKPTWNGGAETIRKWHLDRGWSDIGYHYVIKKDGTVEEGRSMRRIGSHVRGKNTGSIGICWVGGYDGVDDRTDAQKKSLIELVKALRHDYGKLTVHGHNEFSSKSCPNFDVSKEF